MNPSPSNVQVSPVANFLYKANPLCYYRLSIAPSAGREERRSMRRYSSVAVTAAVLIAFWLK